MARQPLIFALANPTPEILPEEVKAVRDDAIMATGRTDYPNQVNNVLCFPYIFRGALDCGATTITDAMEIAAVHAIADLAQAEQSEVVAAAYVGATLSFGPEYLIPKPFDPRLMMKIAPAVAKAAAESGVARRPVQDLVAYREKLQTFVYASGTAMKPIFDLAKQATNKRVAYAEGEDERVLRAVQVILDEGLARPTLIGRPEVIAQRVERFGLRLKEGRDYDIANTENDHRFRDYWQTYHQMMERRGVTAQLAKIEMRRRLTLIGTMMLHKGEVDGLICGTWGSTAWHLAFVDQVIGKRTGVQTYACMNGLILPDRQVFLVDTHVNHDPTAPNSSPRSPCWRPTSCSRFGLKPKAALLSHSNFGSSNQPVGRQDARRAGADPRARALARGRRRDARRRRARRGLPRRADAAHHAQRRGEPAGAAEHRRRQHRLQPAEDGRRRRHRDRAGPARCGQAGAHPDAVGDRAPNRQHDRPDGGGRQRRPFLTLGFRPPPGRSDQRSDSTGHRM